MYFDTIGAKLISNNTLESSSGMHTPPEYSSSTIMLAVCYNTVRLVHARNKDPSRARPRFGVSYPRAPTTFDMLFFALLLEYCGHRGALNGVRAAGPAPANCRTLSSVVSWQIVIQRAQVISCSPRRHRRDQTFKKTSHTPSQ